MATKKPKFKVGQVVWEKNDGSFVQIVKASQYGGFLQVERFGNLWNVLPNNVRALTKRERG